MEMKCPSSSRPDRKTIEKNRRIQMKALHSKLNSLVPHQISREATSLPDQLREATKYIKKLQINLETLRERKDSLLGIQRKGSKKTTIGSRSHQFEIREMGSALEVVLIADLDSQFMFNETIRILHEEDIEIVNASFSVVDDNVFHNIHAKIGESASSCAAARISERLTNFFQW